MIYGLPEKIKKLRKKAGLSQKDLSQRIGISSSIISGYETGERTPSLEILLKISKIFNCSTDFLLGKESPSSKKALNITTLNETQIEAIEKLIESFNSDK